MLLFQQPHFFGSNDGGNDQFTTLLLHCDGTDASTTFTDSSSLAHTVTANGNAQIDTAQSKFGGASGLYDGSGDYLSIASHDGFLVGTGDYTIDLWARPSSTAGAGAIISKCNASTVSPWMIYRSGTNILFFASSDSASFDITNAGAGVDFGDVAVDTWYHMAVVKDGTTYRLFLNGAMTTFTNSSTPMSSADPVEIGGRTDGGNYFAGWIEEVRFSKGIARWSAAFTPPTAPYF